ncbi:hypothetical protein N752_24140 [Desulforamulus aquiferis]|nr:hypothetical protein N752_24140 [Desulforamulus aquiferis]
MNTHQLDKLALEVEGEVQNVYREIEAKAMVNHARVLEGFHLARVSDYHLKGSTAMVMMMPGEKHWKEFMPMCLVRKQLWSGGK